MHRRYLFAGSLAAALAVGLGAFGAHGLKQILTLLPETINAFQTGVQYQMYHALGLLAIAFAHERYPNKWIRRAGTCFITGIFLFSGSLYVITALKATETIGLSKIGILTPVGGLFFIAGWLLFCAGILRKD